MSRKKKPILNYNLYPDLNMERAERILVLKALNKYQSTLDAAAALKITERTVHNKKKQHGIVWCDKDKKYISSHAN